MHYRKRLHKQQVATRLKYQSPYLLKRVLRQHRHRDNFIPGLVLNMVGGILYSWVKYHEGEKKKRDKSGEISTNDSNPETPTSQVRKLL